jgi:acyl-CoA thioesterase-1
MTKFIILFILPFMFFLGCNSNGETIVKGQPLNKLEINENSTIVCFGDSLTYGYGADDIEYSYPNVLQAWVNIPVINAGVNDDTTAGGLKRIQKDVIEHNPVIVIIDFGGNDLYNNKPKLKIKEIENNFVQMIELIGCSNVKIYIARYFNDQMRFLDIFFNFDRMLKRLEKEYNVEIIYDIWKNVWGRKELKYDFTHPNNKGYEIIAYNIFDAIKPTLEYNGLMK